ncbi:MAG: 4-oxalocrotonate tautomerase family protein [Oscillospiraceae bacterium]|jgi:phenylpyruvate tautomerase PptA (4-oxalocrotonate tautomerase family)|nr:4-oxalocrotonate tautomerase family protein [Oscillospiraceae bacterium]
MPFIQMYVRPGRDEETKARAAEALVDAASKAWGAPREAFTVLFEEVSAEEWDAQVTAAIIEPKRDKVLIERGKRVTQVAE